MKISFLIPSIRQGGAERQFILLAKYLNEHGYSVNFITYKDDKCFYDMCGVNRVQISKSKKFDVRFLRSLVGYIRSARVDILFSCYQGRFEGPMIWARLVKLFYPPVKVISGYRSDIVFRTSVILDRMTKSLTSLSITNNPKVLEYLPSLIRMDKKKIIYINNFVDTETFYPLGHEEISRLRSKYFPNSRSKFICGLLGSYRRVKNYGLVIKAAKHLNKMDKSDDIYFSIYGDKMSDELQFSRLKTLVENNSLENLVSLNPSIKEVNELINCFDVLLLPSLHEGMPNVVLEAILCRKPVIISQGGNSAGLIIEGVNGLIFETTNYFQLAECINSIKSNPLVINTSYLEKFYKRHDKKRIVNDYIKCFELLCR